MTEFYPKVERNESCGSTQDNTDGSKSVFYSTGLENSEVTDFALYDKMAKVGHLLVAMPRYTNESSGTTQGEIRYMCMRNTDFAEGSRNPLPKDESQPSGTPTGTGGAPVPTGGAAKRSAGLASLTTAFFVGVFMLFN
jgi:hypothetical protein